MGDNTGERWIASWAGNGGIVGGYINPPLRQR